MKIRNPTRIDHLVFFFFCYLLIVSIFYSRFLASTSIIVLVLLSIVQVETGQRIKFKFNPEFLNRIRQIWKVPPLMALVSILIITIVSYVNSTDTHSWLKFVRLKLPYLALPIIFVCRQQLSQSQYRNLFYFLIQCAFVSAIAVLAGYWSHFESINKTIGMGHAIPTPIIHTKYSTIIAIAAISAIILRIKSHYVWFAFEKHILNVQIAFLIVFLHILSVRSGLVAFYTCSIVFGMMYFIRAKKYRKLIVLVLILGMLPVFAYRFLPSFYNKVHYTLYDWKMMRQGEGDNYNDSMRLRSWKTGWELFKNNPILGVGIGDLERENSELYRKLYPSDFTRPRLPHNQFLFHAAGMGVLGLIAFVASFFIPVFYQSNYRNDLFCCLSLAVLILCMVEKPMERSNFIAFYLFFTLASLNHNGSFLLKKNAETS